MADNKNRLLNKILNLKIDTPPVLLAPMAAVTKTAERHIAEQFGADLTFPEMISAPAIFRGIQNTIDLIQPSPTGKIFTIQLIGKDPHEMEFAARYALDKGVQLIDINMGCPMKDIVKNGQGAALLKTPELAIELLQAVRRGVKDNIPVSVKTRIGWDFNSINILDFAKKMEKTGASFITIHGRTRSQLYSGKSNPIYIKQAVDVLNIPVIANGDIKNSDDAIRILNETNAAGIMIARGSYGNPWIFQNIKKLLNKKNNIQEIDLNERLTILKKHMDLIIKYAKIKYNNESDNEVSVLDETAVLIHIKKQMSWYSKGFPDASNFRNQIFKSFSFNDLQKILVNMEKKI